MDLNYLYHRRGVSLFMSRNSACDRARAAHLGMAERYWALISVEKLKSRLAASA